MSGDLVGGFAPFHARVAAALAPARERYALVLAGGYALRPYSGRICGGLGFVTAAAPLIDAAAAAVRACRAAGLDVLVGDATVRESRLTVTDPDSGRSCPLTLLREALQRPPVRWEGLPVLHPDDAAGLAMRALHGRGLARDLIDVAAVSHLYSFRELERLAGPHCDGFSPRELAGRLEFAALMRDEEFEAYGLGEGRIGEIRRFADAWVEDIKLRRADDGDTDHDFPDLPPVD
ncbi:hypothetical protein [Nonomuraea pusilla]|uniref:hypothetical protein n=1 Tax=Nonomuraea pusilla TaxID=46177 RepID=UPI0021096682|nr:hypothetical protein [Nonomuraea pusilla]